jgi:hypothetical protein
VACCGENRSFRTRTIKGRQKLLNQNQNAEQRTAKGFFLNSRFLKSRSPLQVLVRLLL